jgi:Delta7-sterol 5-desaturase
MADIFLNLAEEHFFTPYVWGAENPKLPLDHPVREFSSLFAFVTVGAFLMYLSFAGLSFIFVFDKTKLRDKRILKNQVMREIAYTCGGIPEVALYTTIVFMFEVWGYSKLYDDVAEFGWGYLAFSIVWFLIFTDCLIYFIHRGLHEVDFLYRNVHKPHHKWIMTTPFASHAFHPMDGFLQGLPYHLFVFFFPLHKITYLLLYVGVNVWTVSIHDCDYIVPDKLDNYINGAAHHTIHHTAFFYNYGQYFTLWDRLFNSHRKPDFEHDNSFKLLEADSSKNKKNQ